MLNFFTILYHKVYGKEAVTLRVEDLESLPYWFGLSVQQPQRKYRKGPAKWRWRERQAAAEEAIVARAAQEIVPSDIAEDAIQSSSAVKAQSTVISEEDTSDKSIKNSVEDFMNDELHLTFNDAKLFKIKDEYRNPKFKPWIKVMLM